MGSKKVNINFVRIDSVVSCKICNLIFTNVSFLDLHNPDNHSSPTYICHSCRNIYPHSAILDSSEGQFPSQMQSGLGCDLCGETVADLHNLHLHMWSVHGSQDTGDSSGITCSLCQDNFVSIKDLENHLLQYHSSAQEIVEVSCDLHCHKCPQTFSNIRLLNIHVLEDHKEQRTFQCPPPYVVLTGGVPMFRGSYVPRVLCSEFF